MEGHNDLSWGGGVAKPPEHIEYNTFCLAKAMEFYGVLSIYFLSALYLVKQLQLLYKEFKTINVKNDPPSSDKY